MYTVLNFALQRKKGCSRSHIIYLFKPEPHQDNATPQHWYTVIISMSSPWHTFSVDWQSVSCVACQSNEPVSARRWPYLLGTSCMNAPDIHTRSPTQKIYDFSHLRTATEDIRPNTTTQSFVYITRPLVPWKVYGGSRDRTLICCVQSAVWCRPVALNHLEKYAKHSASAQSAVGT
jgi:hypothetical protein